MGKTGKWLKNFLTGKKEKDKGRNEPTSSPTKNQLAPILVPSPKEKKRWSFRRSVAGDKELINTTEVSMSTAANGMSETEIEQKRHAMAVAVATAAAADAAVAAAQAAAAVVRLTVATTNVSRISRAVEEAASIKIQTYFRSYLEAERNAEENIKIVEMDLGVPRSNSKSRNSCSITQIERMEARHSTYYPSAYKPDVHQYSPSPSTYTDISPKPCSGHFEEFSFATAQSSPQYFSAMSIADPTHASIDYPFFPNYMANTESSRAKTRSQSAPRQRLDSYERQSSRRRPSMEGRNIPRGIKMQRSSSQVGFVANGHQFPWPLKLDRSNVSQKDSECGSTSTVLTTSNYY